MKGVVLAGGTGSRIRPFSLYIAKQLLPVLNKPVLFHNIDLLLAGGIQDIGIVVGPMKDSIIKAIGESKYPQKANIHFIHQPDPKGLAHAVLTSRPFLQDDDFTMILGDNLFSLDVNELVGLFYANSGSALAALTQVSQPERYGIAEIKNHRIVSVAEKPTSPASNWALAGLYIFAPGIHGLISKLQPSWRNEYEITDAIGQLLAEGQTVVPYFTDGYWRDIGTAQDLLQANIQLLQDRPPERQPESVDSVIEPVLIDPAASIANSVIGPNVAIGPGAVIKNSRLSNSVVLASSYVENANSVNTIFSPWGNVEVEIND